MVLKKTHRGKTGLLSSDFPVVYPRHFFSPFPPQCFEAATAQCLAFLYPNRHFKHLIVVLVSCDEKLRTQ